MAKVDVVVPQVGESVKEGAIGKWFVKSGDFVEKDQALFELDSDKASLEVTAEESGVVEIINSEGETVEIGAVVAKIDTDAKASASSKPKDSKSPKKESVTQQNSSKENKKSETKAATESNSPDVDDSKIKKFPPSQRKAIRHGNTDLLQQGNTLRKLDLQEHSSETSEQRTPMSPLRKTIANRLLYSQQSTATLTTFNEVRMTKLLDMRNQLKDDFQKKFGVKLGFMSFFSAAIVYALKEYSIVNAHIDGDEIVQPKGVHLGIAVSTEKGLVVPVVRNAEKMSYAQLETRISELAEKARTSKLSLSEMQGESFTITNGGVFGSLISTPIINPPQSGILGMHKTEHRPIAVEQADGSYKVEVHPMMYVALSYDHRLIDGASSVGFLVKVKEYLENVTKDQIMS